MHRKVFLFAAILLLAASVVPIAFAQGGKVDLTWYVVGNGPAKDAAAIDAAASTYIQSKGLNANIHITCFDWGTYDQKMGTIIQSGEPFDICFTAVWTNNYNNNVARGAFLALNDPKTNLLGKYAPKTKALLGADFMAGSAVDGVNYAIPANKEKAHNWGFILRSDLVTKYKMNVSKIKKLEDLQPFLQTIKDNEPGMYPLEACGGGDSPRFLLDWDKMIEDDIPVSLYPDNRSSKVINEFEAPETLALFKVIRQFYQAGFIRKDAASVSDFNADEKAGLIFVATKSLKPGKDAEMTNATGHPWQQVDITPAYISNRETEGSMQAISRTSKNPGAAMAFLELFNTDPYLNNLINFGISGQHYVKVQNNIIKAGPKQADYNPGTSWMFGNQFVNYLYTNEDPKKWDKFIRYNKSAKAEKSLGFVFVPDAVSTEMATCKGVWKEFTANLETGTVDPDSVMSDVVAKYKAAGIDTIIAEVQKQYDAFLAKMKITY
ncbi:MAG: ABC transporter substrate-binding protein [Spirochaetia bacterium]|jgi:putative aldouronate transport system substrate-binding protein